MSDSSTHELAEEHGGEVPIYHSLWDLFTEGVKKNADGPAVISLYQGANHLSSLISKDVEDASHLTWTYTELQEAAERLAEILHGTGVRKGSVVALFLYNSVEWCLFFWACAKMEACFAPLNPNSIHRPNELKYLLQTLEPNVLVVQDSNLAMGIEKEAWEIVSGMKLKIICEPSKCSYSEHWAALSTLEALPLRSCDSSNAGNPSNDFATVLFTSGTTSLPKACPHTAAILGSSSQTGSKRFKKEFRYLSNARCFHVAAFVNIPIWRAGATTIIPAREFDAGATLQALYSQRCTHMQVTPSMMYAILNHPLFESHRPSGLTYLGLVAEMVTPDLMTKCEEIFKPKNIRTSWGMTEGIGLTLYGPQGSPPSQDGVLTVGKVSSGSRVRICKPETRIPLKRGEKGEIHCGGTSVIQGYLKDTSHEAFYNDEYGTWFISGDQGTMDDLGNIYIHGRYKNIIIRGGENISPATIESCLNARANVMSQVVGIPDPVMGEGPVAIIKSLSDKTRQPDLKSVLHQLVLRELGTSYALAEVFTLGELGLNDFPMTASGKVIKPELRSRVVEHLSQLDLQRRESQSASTLKQVKSIWGRLLGVSPESIDQSMSATDVADSLTIMRFCYDVEKQFGKRLSLPEISRNPTLERQAQLLEGKEQGRLYDAMPGETRVSSGAPSAQDMPFTSGDPLEATKTAYFVKPALDALHLTWEEDVEDVYQITDAMRVLWSTRHRPASSNIRWAYKIKAVDILRLRRALEDTISRHTTFRSLLVDMDDGAPIHVIIRPSKHFYDQCITEGDEVTTIDRVRHLLGSMDLEFAGPPGPLFRAHIVQTESPGELGLLLSIHHSTYDALSLALFAEDFGSALNHSPTLESRVPFKLFADTYYLHQSGTAAARDVRFQVDRLKGIWKMSKALWPIANGSEWFTGSDRGWTHSSGRPGRLGERLAFDREEQRLEGLSLWRKDTIPSLEKFKHERAVDVSVLVKAAVALFNTEMTGQDHALFCNRDAGRTWPFLEPWIAERLPNPMSIAGPTLTSTLNIITLDPLETIGAFIRRVQVDQVEQSAHAHAPFLAVKRQLGERDGGFVDDLNRRQVFNWDPSMRTRSSGKRDSRELLGRREWLDCGFFWNFGLQGDDNLVGFVLYDDAHVRNHEAKAALDRVFAIVKWMAVPENWTKTVGVVERSLGGDGLHVADESQYGGIDIAL